MAIIFTSSINGYDAYSFIGLFLIVNLACKLCSVSIDFSSVKYSSITSFKVRTFIGHTYDWVK